MVGQRINLAIELPHPFHQSRVGLVTDGDYTFVGIAVGRVGRNVMLSRTCIIICMFNSSEYGTRVAGILALDGAGERLMPLAYGTRSSLEAYKLLKAASPRELFSASRAPEAAMAGLWLYFSCLDEAHQLAQSVETPDGSFWHAIMHRQEPDAGNAAYWFRQTGKHAIFPDLRNAALALEFACGPTWDPFAFIDACEQARRQPGSDRELLMRQVQLAEWQLLFQHCARSG